MKNLLFSEFLHVFSLMGLMGFHGRNKWDGVWKSIHLFFYRVGCRNGLKTRKKL